MTKSDLITELAVTLTIPHIKAASIVTTILKAMTEALVAGDDIELRGENISLDI